MTARLAVVLPALCLLGCRLTLREGSCDTGTDDSGAPGAWPGAVGGGLRRRAVDVWCRHRGDGGLLG